MKKHDIHTSINSKKQFVNSSFFYIRNERPDIFPADKKYIVIYHISRFNNNGNVINTIDRNKSIMKQTIRKCHFIGKYKVHSRYTSWEDYISVTREQIYRGEYPF